MKQFLKNKMNTKEEKNEDYFASATNWATDRVTMNEQSRARYQAAFFASMGLNIVAMCSVLALSSLHTLVPMLVHHYDNGVTTIEAVNNKAAPINRAQIESDIARYVTNRESYDISSYRAQYNLVTLLSSTGVAKEYSTHQKASNKSAPINVLNHKYTRSVHIYSINFLDNLMTNDKEAIKNKKNHANLAEVVFTVSDSDKDTGAKITQSYNALISWQYNKPSASPEIRWQNFDGFEVTRYSKQLRNDKA